MTQLHAYFSLRQQQNFQRLLDGSRGQPSSSSNSNSGGKSWSRPSALTSAMICDVNARDWLGRTVLHLACASVEPSSLEYVRLLLAHPAVNINLQDTESHWTALHRALFHGNISAAVLLLKRSDVDTSLKDFEGYTAFDLYNSTLSSTKPSASNDDPAELFTWGANRNAALGLGDGDDRAYPDQVVLQSAEDPAHSATRPITSRFKSIQVRHVSMSRLHTVVVTSESRGNLRVCGFGSGGRLGPGQHTQYSLMPIPQLTQTIVSVALGQDHTLAVTKAGEVLSWGLNRFSQLGYVIEPSSTGNGVFLGRSEEPVQASPRKIFGLLKKEVVRGVAACKTASACWTDGEVFTWGTNHGQLGYDKAAQPVQILPRKVTKIISPVKGVSITDTALACLLETQDIICIWNDRHFKINFPSHSFPSEIKVVYRPPQAVKDAHIAKITSCDDTFAALSSSGEVFTFSVPSPFEVDASGKERTVIKPQRVWALRKQFSGVRDVALGSDGSLIVATQSGHVFVRSRNAKSGQSSGAKTFKFQRVPYLQRVIGVCANNTGAFGALRVDYHPATIHVSGKTASQHFAAIQPYLRFPSGAEQFNGDVPSPSPDSPELPPLRLLGPLGADDEGEDSTIQNDIRNLERLCLLLTLDKQSLKGPQGHHLFDCIPLTHGADLMVQSPSGSEFPVHRVWLAARSPVLCEVLSRTKTIQDAGSKISLRLTHTNQHTSPTSSLPRLVFGGCSSMSILILLFYLYSDELLSIWDQRIAIALEQHLQDLKFQPAQVKLELQTLARILDLHKLAEVVQSPAKRIPSPSLALDLQRLVQMTEKQGIAQVRARGLTRSPLCPDVIIQLNDRDVLCHSVVLRAGSSLFAALFDDNDWTAKRWDEYGTIKVDMRHWDWRIMQFPLRFLCSGFETEHDLFDTLDFADTADEVLEFMFQVMAAANELLLYSLVILCSTAVLKHLTINNTCYMLSDATHFQVRPLMHALHDYMAANMETLLEGRMLDDLKPNLIKQLTEFVRERQAEKFAVTRSTRMFDRAVQNHGEWLALQDIPQPVIRAARSGAPKESPNLSSPGPNRRHRRLSNASITMSSPVNRPLATIYAPPLPLAGSGPSGDEIFVMDDTEVDAVPSGESITSQGSPVHLDADTSAKRVPVWTRRPSAPRVDMKSIMAEAENNKSTDPKAPGFSYRAEKIPQRERRKMQWSQPGDTAERPDSLTPESARMTSSPWKVAPAPAISPMAFPTLALPSTSPANSTPFGTPPAGQSRGKHPDSKMLPTPPVTPKPSGTPPRSPFSQSGPGPIFIPSRQSLAKSGSSSRHVSGPAWTFPPVQPVVESSPLGPNQSLSFVAIQQLQLDQGFVPVLDKRSLLEIQEEEQARQAEDDFLKWWAAEEERVKLESQTGHGQGQGLRKAKGPKTSTSAINTPADGFAGVTGGGGCQSEGRRTSRRPAKSNKADRPKLNTT